MQWGTSNAPKKFDIANLLPKSPEKEIVPEPKFVENRNVQLWKKKEKGSNSNVFRFENKIVFLFFTFTAR